MNPFSLGAMYAFGLRSSALGVSEQIEQQVDSYEVPWLVCISVCSLQLVSVEVKRGMFPSTRLVAVGQWHAIHIISACVSFFAELSGPGHHPPLLLMARYLIHVVGHMRLVYFLRFFSHGAVDADTLTDQNSDLATTLLSCGM